MQGAEPSIYCNRILGSWLSLFGFFIVGRTGSAKQQMYGVFLIPPRFQRKPDGRTDIRPASHVYRLPVRLDNMLADGQPEPCPPLVPAPGSICPVEPLEDP